MRRVRRVVLTLLGIPSITTLGITSLGITTLGTTTLGITTWYAARRGNCALCAAAAIIDIPLVIAPKKCARTLRRHMLERVELKS